MSVAEKLVTIAENQERVYDAGKQAEYDRFWDVFQQNGNRTNYEYAFYGESWTKDSPSPKYDLKPTNAQYMFSKSPIANIEEWLEKSNLTLDTSECTNVFRMFNGIEHNEYAVIPVLDLRKATNLAEMFAYSNYTIVRKLILNDSGTQDLSTTFHGAMFTLTEIRFEGTIGSNLRLEWSTELSNESVQSIIDHLKDLTGETAKTLKFHATIGAKLTDEQKATITAKNWTLVY